MNEFNPPDSIGTRNPIAKQIKIINMLIDDNFYSSDGAYAKVFGRLISLMSEKILEDHC